MYRIFISGMAYDNGESGIANYIENVTHSLSKNNTIDIIMLKKDAEKFPVKNSNINIITVSNRLKNPLINMLWHIFLLPMKIKKSKYDFIFLPAGNRRLMLWNPLPTITTVHDLSQFHIDNKYDWFRTLYIFHVIPALLKKVNSIISVSKSTKDDLIDYYKIKNSKIRVAYNGYNANLYNLKAEKNNVNEIFSIKKRYFLYISRIEHPGKNHMNLIKAYQMLHKDIRDKYDLVFGGSFKERSDEVVQYVNKIDEKSNIHFLGFVNTSLLPLLYKNADIFILPSLYEGFGIPLVEAMACNLLILCSNRGSLPEIGGNAVLTFDPENAEEISQKISHLLENIALQDSMKEKGLSRVKEFSWDSHSEAIIDEYERLI